MKHYQRLQVPFKIIDDTCYIVDSFRTKSAYKLNETSTLLWTFLEAKKSHTEIVEHFKDSYEIQDDENLDQDLREVLQEMLESSLIHEL